MKKISFLVMSFVFALLIPLSSAHAGGNGQWNYLGSYDLNYRSQYGWWDTANVRSTGGGLRIKGEIYNVDYELWEYDPGSNNDDYIGHHFQGVWDPYGIFNVNSYVDGSNNRAELYVKTYADGDSVKFWD